MSKQCTIGHEVTLDGIGIHTANKTKIVLKPAGIDAGITFVRTDLEGSPVIKANTDSLIAPAESRRTSIGSGKASIQTIEHLLAVLSGLGIDNITIEIDNNEVPGFDGSGLPFVEAISRAGIVEQEKEKLYFAIKEPIYIEEEGSTIMALPCSEFRISYTLSFNHPALKSGFLEVGITPEAFKKEIAPSRTFCLEEEVEKLQKLGLGQGASYDNTLVVGKDGVINNKLRFPDEFTRHKILDLMGDLNLLGCPIKGHIIALKSGHAVNIKLAKKIAQQKERLKQAGIAGSYQPVQGQELDVTTIKKILPHREPFLLVDRIIRLELGKRATGIKNVTINDYFFKGHFPQKPVMPGVLIVEAMAQVGGVMMLAPEENRGKLAFFMSINNIKFRKTVVPGDQLVMEVEAGKMKSKTGQVFGKAYVDGKLVCEAELMFALVEN